MGPLPPGAGSLVRGPLGAIGDNNNIGLLVALTSSLATWWDKVARAPLIQSRA